MKPEDRKWALPLLLGDFLTLLLLLAGGIFSYFTPYTAELAQVALLGFCILAALLSTLLWSLPNKYRLLPLGLLAAGGLILRRMWTAFAAEWQYHGRSPGLLDMLERRSWALILLTALLALLLGWVVLRVRCWYLAALAVMTPVLPAILGGVLPDWMALMAATAGWGTMLLTSFYSRRDRSSLGRGVLLSLGGITALLLLLTVVLPQDGYERPQWATDTRDSLLSFAAEASGETWDWELPPFLDEYFNLGGIGDGGSGTGTAASFSVNREGRVNLLNAGPRRYTGRTVLQVEGAQAGLFYLWGGSAMEYTGTSWEAGAAYGYDRMQSQLTAMSGSAAAPEIYPALTAPATAEQILHVRHLSAGGTAAYFPYRLSGVLTEGAGVSSSGNAVRSRGLREYQVSYRPGSPVEEFVPLEGDVALSESIYREFVYTHYLYVPPEAVEALLPLAEGMGDISSFYVYGESWEWYSWYSAIAAAQRIAQMLDSAAVYDLDTPAMEQGEDFVAQFLEEGRGYCVHFATAGALLLRMNGIPARYVSGYVFQGADEDAVYVKDGDAHAWVEIYLDGYGWYPVEMTPGYRGMGDEVPGIITEEDKPEELPTVEAETPAPPQKQETPDSPKPPQQETPELEGPAASEAPEVRESLDWSWVWKAGAVLLLLALPFGVYRLRVLLIRRRREMPDANRSVIEAYLCYRRLLVWGAEEDSVLEELARKAKFSHHTLTAGERESAWSCTEELVRQLHRALPWWKRIPLCLLHPLKKQV